MNKVPDITEDNPKSFGVARVLRSEWLYLYTLTYWHGEVTLQSLRVVEDGTVVDFG